MNTLALSLSLVMVTMVGADLDHAHHGQHGHHGQHAQHGAQPATHAAHAAHGGHHAQHATHGAHHAQHVQHAKHAKPAHVQPGLHKAVHHGPRPVPVVRKPVRPVAAAKRRPLKRRPVQPFNPFLAAQRVLPHNPRPIRGLHNNLPVRPPRPQPHHLRRPNINAIPSAPTKAPVAVQKPGKSVAAMIAENEHFSTLHTALKAAGMMENLAGAGPFTVFAPTNAAFDKVPVDSLNKLMANKEELKKVLERHILPGVRLEGKAVPDGSTKLTSASGAELRTEREKFVKVHTPEGSAFVVKFDFLGSNGVYHAIDQVL